MKTIPVSGGWYCDALPDGAFAVLVSNRHVLTHLGIIPFLDIARQPLFIRATTVGGFKFAGQSWNTNETLQWEDGKGWSILPPVGGVSPVIYRNTGQLHRTPYIYPDGSVCSQGWRFEDINSVLWNGDETYGPSSRAPRMFEWTDLSQGGDTLVIGQGEESGIVVWDGRVHRQVKSGRWRFVRAHRALVNNEDVISIGSYQELGANITDADPTWLTREDIAQLPIIDFTTQVAPLPRPIWTGYYFSMSDRYGDNPSAPGSVQLVIEPAAVSRAVALGMNVIVPLECAPLVPLNQLVAVEAGGATIEEVETSIAAARVKLAELNIPRPIVSYLDKADWPRLPNPQPDWYAPQAYCGKDETLTAFQSRVQSLMQKFPSDKPILLICQAYNTNLLNTDNLLPLQYVYPEIAREDSRVIGMIWFSDGRTDAITGRGGTRANPTIRVAHSATQVASPGVPALQTIVGASPSRSTSRSASASPSGSPSPAPIRMSESASPSASESASPSASPSFAPPDPPRPVSIWIRLRRWFRRVFR